MITNRKSDDRRSTQRLQLLIKNVDIEYSRVLVQGQPDRRSQVKNFTFTHFEILNEGK